MPFTYIEFILLLFELKKVEPNICCVPVPLIVKYTVESISNDSDINIIII